MNYIEILEAALSEKSMSRKKLAEALGVSPAAITNILTQVSRNGVKRSGINLNTFLAILEELEYEVVIQKKTQGRRKEGQMVLTKEE